jgi:hypothetical protein
MKKIAMFLTLSTTENILQYVQKLEKDIKNIFPHSILKTSVNTLIKIEFRLDIEHDGHWKTLIDIWIDLEEHDPNAWKMNYVPVKNNHITSGVLPKELEMTHSGYFKLLVFGQSGSFDGKPQYVLTPLREKTDTPEAIYNHVLKWFVGLKKTIIKNNYQLPNGIVNKL